MDAERGLSNGPMSVCLSHHSTAAASCGGFAAERRAGRDIDRPWRATCGQEISNAASAGRPAATAPQHGAQQQTQQCHVDSRVEAKLNTRLSISQMSDLSR